MKGSSSGAGSSERALAPDRRFYTWIFLGLLMAILVLSLRSFMPRDAGHAAEKEQPPAVTDELANDEREETKLAARPPTERRSVQSEERLVWLELTRWPDGARLGHSSLTLRFTNDRGMSDVYEASSDEQGEVRCRLAISSPALEIAIDGYEEARLSLPADEDRAVEVELRPGSGWFGRVVDMEGKPVVGAAVGVLVRRPIARAMKRGDGILVKLAESRRAVDHTESDAGGWYFLEERRPAPGERNEIVARAGADTATLELEERHFEEVALLPDIVLGAVEALAGLRLRVIDDKGDALPGAHVRGLKNGYRVTDQKGVCTIPEPTLPDTFFANAEGYELKGLRIGGVDHPPGFALEDADEEVELVLRELSVALFRIVDHESGAPLWLAAGRLETLDDQGRKVGLAEFETGPEGLGRAQLAPSARSVVVQAWSRMHEREESLEIGMSELSSDEPFEIRLRGVPGSHLIRGRVLRSGVPVKQQIGVTGVLPDPESGFRRSSGVRCYSNDEGNFTVRWMPNDPAELVGAYPHWTVFDEFGSAGPLPIDEALSTELLIDIRPGLLVPVMLRGAREGGRYALYVSSVRDQGQLPITINGAPIKVASSRDFATHVHVPAHWVSRLTVGYRTSSSVFPDAGTAVIFDPKAPQLPLVFECDEVYATVEGQIVNVGPGDCRSLRVIAFHEKERNDIVATPAASGAFRMPALPFGSYELLVVAAGPDPWKKPLASQRLELEADVQDIVLHVDYAGEH